MAHYAQIEATQDPDLFTVVQNIVAEPEFIATGAVGDSAFWIQNSYNTRGGVHYDPVTGEPSEDQSKALRGNFAGIGFIYDKKNDVFYPPKPADNAILNMQTWLWELPVTDKAE